MKITINKKNRINTPVQIDMSYWEVLDMLKSVYLMSNRCLSLPEIYRRFTAAGHNVFHPVWQDTLKDIQHN